MIPAGATKPSESARSPGPDVDDLLAAMTVEQKVGQLMMIGFAGTEVDPDVEALVKGREVGGICLFKRNVVSAAQVAKLNSDLRGLLDGRVPPFIALDQEGGNVVRIDDGNVVLPGAMALGATHSPELAYRAGRAQAEDLILLGFNMNLAPVLDVNMNPRNPVIGIRSFGDRPGVVADFGAAFVRGQQDANIVTVAKHFPGHGSTDADSHRALPVMSETPEEVRAQLEPFVRVIGEGLDGLMTAHVAIPKLTGHSHPATLSPEVLTTLLRKDLSFDGLVVTDELEMEAIAKHYGVGRAAVMSVKAGADMVLVPWRAEKKTEVYESLLAAAKAGELSQARLDEAVRRILLTKVRRGLFDAPPPLEQRLAKLGDGTRHSVMKEVARNSVTLLRTDARWFPITGKKKIGVLTAESALGQAILSRAPDAKVVVVSANPDAIARSQQQKTARQLALESDVLIVGLINSRQLELVKSAAATGKPVLVVSMGLPYLVEQLSDARAVLAVYSYQDASAEAAAAALFGEQGTPGRLPVTLSKQLPWGYGLDAVGRRLADGSAPPAARAKSAE
ncbi:MAG: beta-N-acetylhexosaminidase [Myxococcaceae bacterium]